MDQEERMEDESTEEELDENGMPIPKKPPVDGDEDDEDEEEEALM